MPSTPPDPVGPLIVMGGGNMASAIIRGGLASGVLAASLVTVCEPDPHKHAAFAAIGVKATASHAEALRSPGTLLLAVKPQSLTELAEQLRPHLTSPTLVLSILAGVQTSRIQQALGPAVRLVRAMPNTAAAIRRSTTAICNGPGVQPEDTALARRLFDAIGTTQVIDESLMDAATAVVGSGPAYLFFLAEAMLEGATAAGFDSPVADRLVRSMLAGASELLAHSADTSAADLRAAVTSKGGTTAAAIGVFERDNVRDAVRRAVLAARDRSRELAQIPTDKPQD